LRGRHVRFWSKADTCGATSHVRFTPNSDRESGFPHKVMSVTYPLEGVAADADVCFGSEADIWSATRDVRYGPKADIPDNWLVSALWPTITAALTSKHHWLVIACDSCGTVIDLDLIVSGVTRTHLFRIALDDVGVRPAIGTGARV
jgi:hypothetical protein